MKSRGEQPYGRDFYESRDAATRLTAARVLGFLREELGFLRRVVDLGCGVGTWLDAAAALGAESILGVDGPWVDRDLLVVPPAHFQEGRLPDVDLPAGRFDLAICLEVAEHLPQPRSADLVDLITASADLVLFSAAVPGQPGTGHVNCQWPAEWAGIFQRRGYACFDVIRPLLWGDSAIPYYYQQNSIVLVRRDRQDLMAGLLRLPDWRDSAGRPRSLVHPELHMHLLSRRDSVHHAWRQLVCNVKRRLRQRTDVRAPAQR